MAINLSIKNRDVLEDCLTKDGCSFDIIFSDPPYNLNTKWKIDKITGRYETKSAVDFLSKWDGLDGKFLDSMFQQFYRILKHGGYCVLYCASRQSSPFYYYAVKHGFEIMEPLYWYYTKSFPKVIDVTKALKDKGINNTDFEGYKYSQTPLKQVLDMILVFRKPAKFGIQDDILAAYQNDKIHPSCFNIDDSRVPFISESDKRDCGSVIQDGDDGGVFNKETCRFHTPGYVITPHDNGRFPSQLFVDEHCKNVIDEQSGERRSGSPVNNRPLKHYNFERDQKFAGNVNFDGYTDKGGASKILHVCSYEQEHDLVVFASKVGKSERNAGCERNAHPCVKPISLNYRILKLFKLPKTFTERIYIPFSGSGSEVIAAVKNGYNEIHAVEIDKEHIKVAVERIKYWSKTKIKEETTKPKLF